MHVGYIESGFHICNRTYIKERPIAYLIQPEFKPQSSLNIGLDCIECSISHVYFPNGIGTGQSKTWKTSLLPCCTNLVQKNMIVDKYK